MRSTITTTVTLLVALGIAGNAFSVDVISFEGGEDIAELHEIDPNLVPKYKNGTRDLVSDRYKNATDSLSKVFARAPDFDMAIRRLGRARFELGERNEGLALLEKAYELNPRPGTAYWLALYRWRCHRDGAACSATDGTEAIIPLVIEAHDAFPLHGNVVELVVGVACDSETGEGGRLIDRMISAADGTNHSGSMPNARSFVGFPTLDDQDHICFHRVLAQVLDAAEAEPTNEELQTLLKKLSYFKANKTAADAPRAAIWLLERQFDSEPNMSWWKIDSAVESVTQISDDPDLEVRGLRLLVRADQSQVGDIKLLRKILERAKNVHDVETLQYLVDRTAELIETEDDPRKLLSIQARAAYLISDWTTVARVAKKLKELNPNAESPNYAEDMLAMYEGPKFKTLLTKIWIEGEGSWLQRFGAFGTALLAGLAFIFGLNRIAVAYSIDAAPATAEDRPESELETVDWQLHSPVIGQSDAPRWPKIQAFLEVVLAIVLIIGGGFFIGWSVGSDPRLLHIPPIALFGIAQVAYGALIVIAGWALRATRCRNLARTSSLGSNIVAGLVFGIIMVAGAFITATVQGLLNLEPTEQRWIVEMVRNPNVATIILIPILGILIVPFAEEVFFRGFVFERLFQGGGAVFAYTLSALLFAAVHFNPASLAVYLVQGVVLARAYQHRRSIMTAAVAHSVNNAVYLFALMVLNR